ILHITNFLTPNKEDEVRCHGCRLRRWRPGLRGPLRLQGCLRGDLRQALLGHEDVLRVRDRRPASPRVLRPPGPPRR
ncbi:unnamed protein product, partial [Discosporangium mesarthrocarpum]